MSTETPTPTTPQEKQPLTAEFDVNGKTLVYDFSELKISQVKLAEAVYEYQIDLDKKPPRNFQEKITLGAADYDLVVLSYIVLLRNPDGTLQKFKGGETQQPILNLVKDLPASQLKKVREVIDDFFERCGRLTLALLVQTRYDREYSMQLARMLQASMDAQPTSPERSETETDDTSDSTDPVSAHDA